MKRVIGADKTGRQRKKWSKKKKSGEKGQTFHRDSTIIIMMKDAFLLICRIRRWFRYLITYQNLITKDVHQERIKESETLRARHL